MKNGWVDAVIVGADRICANGDTANKIGTYGLAILAAEHDIPFYVAAPSSTVDLTLSSGEQIPIESATPRSFSASPSVDLRARHHRGEQGFRHAHQGRRLRDATGARASDDDQAQGGGYSFRCVVPHDAPGISVYNPAFDVTPANYITAFITENGVIRPEPTSRPRSRSRAWARARCTKSS